MKQSKVKYDGETPSPPPPPQVGGNHMALKKL